MSQKRKPTKPPIKVQAAQQQTVKAQRTEEIKEKIENFWSKNKFAALAIVVGAFALYAYCMTFKYVLDDQIVYTNNKFVKQGFDGISKILGTESMTGYFGEQKNLIEGARYRPLSIVTFAIEYAFYKENSAASHFINILLYALSGLMLFRLFALLFPINEEKKWYLTIPFLTAFLFILHPIHTEVVANVKGRDEIMAVIGAIATLYYSIRYLDKNNALYLWLSGIAFFLGILAKENVITFLAIVPMTAYFFRNADMRKMIKVATPLFIFLLLYLLMRYRIIGYLLGGKEITDVMNNPWYGMSFSERMATIFYTLWRYIQLLFFPHPLTHDYYPYQIPTLNWGDFRASGSLLVHLALVGYSIWGIFKKHLAAYCILFYLITLSIVSNIPFSVGTTMNERFVYLSSIGFCLFLAWFISEKLPQLTKNTSNNLLSLSIFGVLALGYGAKTIERIPAWKDANSLNTSAVKVSPNSARANLFTGVSFYELYQKEQFADKKKELIYEAQKYCKRAVEILPKYGNAQHMLGGIQAEIYKYDDDLKTILVIFEENMKYRNLLTVVDPKTKDVFADQYLSYLNKVAATDPMKKSMMLDFYAKVAKMQLDERQDKENALRYVNMGLQLEPSSSNLLGLQNSLK